MKTCKNCDNPLKAKKIRLWETPKGPAFVCSDRCFREMNGEEVKPIKAKKREKEFSWEQD